MSRDSAGPGHTEAECPADGCTGTIRIQRGMPAGIYPCICHACHIDLAWADTDYQPELSLAPKPRQ